MGKGGYQHFSPFSTVSSKAFFLWVVKGSNYLVKSFENIVEIRENAVMQSDLGPKVSTKGP